MATSSNHTTECDVAIIGGGIIGLATAHQLGLEHPELRVVVHEKEAELAFHQTGHNSGVLHSGIYYQPGSLKARNCRAGKLAMEAFCRDQGIDHEICGKVIVAVDDGEVPRLERILERGRANGVRCELIGPERLAELEPHAAGVQAIHVPEAGIINYSQVCRRMAELLRQRGGEVLTQAPVRKIEQTAAEVVLTHGRGETKARYGIACGGLHSDRVARLAGAESPARIVPFRGEFYELKPSRQHLCRNLIYPVPNPSFPFLGVHFTRMIDGSVECGPNAVLALAREGYRKRDINLRDLWETLAFRGFQRLAWRYWRVGAGEVWRSFSKRAFVRALQRLMPEIRSEDLAPARSGVRAQAVARDGAIVDDFVIIPDRRMVHVTNAPSPAATSSLNIGRLVVEQLNSILG